MRSFLLAALPMLPGPFLGAGRPPIERSALSSLVAGTRSAPVVQVVLLRAELEAWASGGPAEAIGDLASAGSLREAWRLYADRVERVAEQARLPVLADWIRVETGLKSALEALRARRLEEEVPDFEGDPALASAAEAWALAKDPIEGERRLDEARWRWLDENVRFFGYGDEELFAYAARLLLLERWARIEGRA